MTYAKHRATVLIQDALEEIIQLHFGLLRSHDAEKDLESALRDGAIKSYLEKSGREVTGEWRLGGLRLTDSNISLDRADLLKIYPGLWQRESRPAGYYQVDGKLCWFAPSEAPYQAELQWVDDHGPPLGSSMLAKDVTGSNAQSATAHPGREANSAAAAERKAKILQAIRQLEANGLTIQAMPHKLYARAVREHLQLPSTERGYGDDTIVTLAKGMSKATKARKPS